MSATNVAHAGKRGNVCVGNNVSSFARALRFENIEQGVRRGLLTPTGPSVYARGWCSKHSDR